MVEMRLYSVLLCLSKYTLVGVIKLYCLKILYVHLDLKVNVHH